MSKALGWIDRLELIVAGLCLTAAAVALCADVFSRELLGDGIYGVQKFAVYCCAVSGALGISIVVDNGGHLRITAIDGLLPAALLEPVARIGDAISAAIFAFLAFHAVQFVQNTFNFGETDTILNIQIWWVQAILPTAFGLAALKFTARVIDPGLRKEESGF